MWPHEDLASAAQVHELKDPPVDLSGFFNADEEATKLAAAQIRSACLKYGFFQVVNHGVDARLICSAQQHMDAFFNLPLTQKLSVKRKPGDLCGYSGAHSDRFSSKLPWKETFSLTYDFATKSILGQDFEEAG
ncbi:gibberellin 20 oxidase 1-b [Phtheirospermum japonicum]|uniref:Gibberellin 20 oxidase 1-b n=1 Tax=Phtheirospermum japonicum TaxID=374723 RepID=A0A830D0R6_9LAMI|nr:gibberellin 20 oxidase 1-b [Phtheirospermum japonicum]